MKIQRDVRGHVLRQRFNSSVDRIKPPKAISKPLPTVPRLWSLETPERARAPTRRAIAARVITVILETREHLSNSLFWRQASWQQELVIVGHVELIRGGYIKKSLFMRKEKSLIENGFIRIFSNGCA
jgi:hypothetical protein